MDDHTDLRGFQHRFPPGLAIVAVLVLVGLALRGPQVAAAEIVVMTGGSQVDAIRLTPSAPVIWFGQGLSIQDGLVHRVPRAAIGVSFADTKAHLVVGEPLSEVGVWLAYDPTALNYGVGSAAGVDRPLTVLFPNSGLSPPGARGTGALELWIPWSRFRALLVRGTEAWAGAFEDSGLGDLEPDSGVRFHVGQLRSLSGGASADGLAAGDFVALIDTDRLVVAATWLTQQDLKDGGIVR